MDIFLIKSKSRDLCMKQSRLDFYLSLTAQRIFIHIFEHEILFLKVFSLLPNSLLPNSSSQYLNELPPRNSRNSDVDGTSSLVIGFI